jgi:multicomponent K+:H+ antiporter subunit G
MSYSIIAEIIAAILLVTGAFVAFVGSLGLLRLRTFYERMHTPTLGTTLGMVLVSGGSLIYFSAHGHGPVVHEALVIIFVTVTTPVSLITLVRAGLFRERSEVLPIDDQPTR